MALTSNPEWGAAPFELQLIMADGKVTIEGMRFSAQDKDAAIKALKEHDSDTLNALAVPRHIEL